MNRPVLYVVVVVCTAHLCASRAAQAQEARAFPEMVAPVLHATESSTRRNGKTEHTNIDVYYPRVDGELPVLLVVGGLNGVLPTRAYSEFLAAIAARGVIVVIPNGRFLMADKFRERAKEVAQTADWLVDGLPHLMALQGDGVAPHPRLKGLLIMGHSSGGQAAVAAYELLGKKVAGIILLDPVDGDPFNMYPRVIGPGQQYPKSPQLLLLTTELCNQPGWNIKWFPPCCPEGVSAQHFYDAFTARKWWINALDYAHVDLLDSPFTGPVNFVRFCKASNDRYDKRIYREFAAHNVAGFASRIAWGHAFPPVFADGTPQLRYEMHASD